MSPAYNSPSMVNLLMATLMSARSTRRFRQIIFEREFGQFKKESVRTELSRLKKLGYVINKSDGWKITKQGEKHLQNRQILSFIDSPFAKNSISNTIVSFDIPERKRKTRNWLRNQLKIFNYKILQQSLWIGPGPLPSSFLKRLEDLNIRKNIKTFKLTK